MAVRALADAFVRIRPDSSGFRAEADTQLNAALAGLSPQVRITANTDVALTKMAELRAKMDVLSRQVVSARMVADDKQLQLELAKITGQLATLRKRTTASKVTLDGADKVETQVMALDILYDKIAARVLDAHVSLDDADAQTRLAFLVVELSDLSRRVYEARVGLEGDAAQKMGVLVTELEAITEKTWNIRLGVSGESEIAAASQKLAALNTDLEKVVASQHFLQGQEAGLAEADAMLARGVQLLTESFGTEARATKTSADAFALLRGDADKTTPSITRFWGVWRLLLGKVPLFAGAGAIAGWHLLADVFIELVAVIGPAIIALGAFAAAAEPTIFAITNHIKALQTVSLATGQNVGILTGSFVKLGNAVQPRVMELFGMALQVVNQHTGEFQKLAQGAGLVVDQFGARISQALGSHAFTEFLSNAVKDLSQLFDIIGNVAGVFGTFFRVMPGYAHVLLALADGASKVLEAFTHLISPLIQAGLYVHGFFIYAGLAVTGIVALIRWLPVLGGMLVNIGLKFFRMGKLAVEALTSPLGVTALFFAAFVTLAVVIGRTQDATVRWANSLQNAIDNSKSLPQVFTNTVIALSRVTDAMRNFGQESDTAGKAINNQGAAIHDGVQGLSDTAKKYQELLPIQQKYHDELALESSRLGSLTKMFGTAKEAIGVYALAGIKVTDIAKANHEQWLLDIIQMNSLVKGYAAMGQQAGLLSNDVGALTLTSSDQLTNVQKLNSAWQTFISTVTGSETAFVGFQQQLIGVGDAAKGVAGSLGQTVIHAGAAQGALKNAASAADKGKASMNGLNAASLNLRSAFGGVVNQGSTLIQALTQQAAVASDGSKATHQLTQAGKDLVEQLLPVAKGSKAARDQVYALAQEAGYHGVNSFKALSAWTGYGSGGVKGQAAAERDLNKITLSLTTSVSDLNKDVQKLSLTLSQQLNTAMAKTILNATGGTEWMTKFATAVNSGHTSIQQLLPSGAKLAQQLIDVTGNTKDAHAEFDTFAIGLGLSKDKADKLWASLIRLGKVDAKPTVEMKGNGQYTITGPGIKKSQGPGGSGNAAGGLAGGGLIRGGSGPTADDVVARLSKGELVVPAYMVKAGAVDHLRGSLPGFSSGGAIGTMPTPKFVGGMWDNFQKDMTAAMISAMRNTIRADEIAARSGGLGIVSFARSFLGKIPYTWGGTGLRADDCSGFTQAVYGHFGYGAPRTSEDQGSWVKRAPPQPGGLAFYHSPAGGGDPGHVAIVQDSGSVISQGGPEGVLGPTIEALRFLPLLFTGIPPGGFRSGGAGGATAAGQFDRGALERLWDSAGGPASKQDIAAAIALAESGGDPNAHNPSGASGLWQILGQLVPGNIFNPSVNAENAVAKYRGAGGFSPWVTYESGAYRQFLDHGGWLPPGPSLAINNTGRPERVLGPNEGIKVVLEVKTGPGPNSMDRALLDMITSWVRVKGGGDVQAAFGTS